MYFTAEDILERRRRLSQVWDTILDNSEAVLIHSGAPIQKPGGLDQSYPFLPHPSYFWISGRRREHELILYNKQSGWIEFHRQIPIEESIWENERNDILIESKGKDLSELENILKNGKFSNIYHLGQTQTPLYDKGLELRTAMDKCRRIKDAAEIRLICNLADIASEGYKVIAAMMQEGTTETDIKLAFENTILRHGAHGVPYDSIVGSGRNSAILHALPTSKRIAANELILVDAGAEIYDYCVDITRTYYSGKTFSGRHSDLYKLVLKAQQNCIELCKAGNWWRDVHGTAARILTEGLRDLGILKGSLDELIEQEVISVFFPHGLGHLVGLRVRDTGQEENLHPKKYFGARLRVDIQLEAGHLITVEPGCYFIEGLLNRPDTVSRFGKYIDRHELEHWLPIGGVRIEDNILVGDNTYTNLTEGIEKFSG